MQNLPTFLTYALNFVAAFKYPLVFVAAIVEGPILMIASGFLFRLGYFSLVPLYFVLVLGDFMADIGWYYVGAHFAEPMLRKHGHFLSITPEIFEKIKVLFHRYHEKILIISKLTVGFGMSIATLVTAGATGVPFKKFSVLNAVGEMILVAVMLTIGYFFGHLYTSIARDFKFVFLGGAVIIVAAVIFGFSRFVKSKIVG